MAVKPLYKCRLCGEVYSNSIACGVSEAEFMFFMQENGEVDFGGVGVNPTLTDVHFCKDKRIGMSDFVGVESYGDDK